MRQTLSSSDPCMEERQEIEPKQPTFKDQQNQRAVGAVKIHVVALQLSKPAIYTYENGV